MKKRSALIGAEGTSYITVTKFYAVKFLSVPCYEQLLVLCFDIYKTFYY